VWYHQPLLINRPGMAMRKHFSRYCFHCDRTPTACQKQCCVKVSCGPSDKTCTKGSYSPHFNSVGVDEISRRRRIYQVACSGSNMFADNVLIKSGISLHLSREVLRRKSILTPLSPHSSTALHSNGNTGTSRGSPNHIRSTPANGPRQLS
jgi:hypothetical protein